MFSVIFEVQPKPDRWDAYLSTAKMLRSELEQVDGFVDNIRYKSLTRVGWILSLSGWRDEKAVVRWRTTMRHHMAQEKGRSEIFLDYHLRVGQITSDNRVPEGHSLIEQRLDETETGSATTVTLINGKRPAEWVKSARAVDVANWLGLDASEPELVAWDVFDAVLMPGDVILLLSWRDKSVAEAFENRVALPESIRRRRIRVVRDYGMFDRHEAPQYYPAVTQEAPHYYLFSTSERTRIGGIFALEEELWAFVRARGFCREVVEREDSEPKRILNPGYEIHACTSAGLPLGGGVIRGRP